MKNHLLTILIIAVTGLSCTENSKPKTSEDIYNEHKSFFRSNLKALEDYILKDDSSRMFYQDVILLSLENLRSKYEISESDVPSLLLSLNTTVEILKAFDKLNRIKIDTTTISSVNIDTNFNFRKITPIDLNEFDSVVIRSY